MTESALTCLTPEQSEDERLVTLIKGVGAPPPFSSQVRNFGQPHKDWVCAFLAELPSPTMAARIMGVGVKTLYRHRDSDPVFRTDWANAVENAHDTILGAAAEEALGVGSDFTLSKDGKVIAIPKKRSERLLDAWLKFRLGERHIHEGGAVEPGSMVIAVTPTQLDALTRQERRDLTRLLAKIESAADGKPKTINATPEAASALEHEGG